MHQPTFLKHFLYWMLPTFITLGCVFVYFYDIFGWSHIIAHPVNREFGLVENLQLVILGVTIYIAYKGIRNNHHKTARQCFRLLIALTIIIILEEIDYGLHYWDYYHFTPEDDAAIMQIDYSTEVRNLHNNGKFTSISKFISYALIAILFVVLPLLPSKWKEKTKLYKHLSPSKLIVTTAVSLLIVNNIALHLYRTFNDGNQALNGNVSEFEEIMTYYIFMLYAFELAYSDKLSGFFASIKTKSAKPMADISFTPANPYPEA